MKRFNGLNGKSTNTVRGEQYYIKAQRTQFRLFMRSPGEYNVKRKCENYLSKVHTDCRSLTKKFGQYKRSTLPK